MKIAIIGAGITGLTAAYKLHRRHDVTVYEAEARIGGHTATMDVEHGGRHYAIDTGFIVFNDWTYPNFIGLIDELGVASQPTEMSFSVHSEANGLEYGGNNLNTLFAQRANLLRPSFLRMLRDILRFNRESVRDLDAGQLDPSMRLGEYLERGGYGRAFREHYLIPMGSAIWSASIDDMEAFPLLFFVRFFRNHGLLSVNDRPQWRVIRGGSRSYLEPMTRGFAERIVTSAGIRSVRRAADGAEVHFADGRSERFDEVIFACHSDQALALLADPSRAESRALGAIAYQPNDVVLHTDTRLLPRSRRAWSSWNYRLRAERQTQAVLTYDMNILQGIDSETTFCVTLNATDLIDDKRIIDRFEYAHPVFSLDALAAADRVREFNGENHTWYAGAWLGNGFHEDGVNAALAVVEGIGRRHPQVTAEPRPAHA